MRGSDHFAALPKLPRDTDEPVFAEPWQAQAFALAVKLSEEGHFSWKEWAAALTEELKSAANRGEPDDGSHYYEHWLTALERLVTAKGLSNPAAMLARKEAWADAYRHTPHGKPVELDSTADAGTHNNKRDKSVLPFNCAPAFSLYVHLCPSDGLPFRSAVREGLPTIRPESTSDSTSYISDRCCMDRVHCVRLYLCAQLRSRLSRSGILKATSSGVHFGTRLQLVFEG